MATTTSGHYEEEEAVRQSRSESLPSTNRTARHIVRTSDSLRIRRELYSLIGSTAVAYTDDLSVLAVGQENGSIQLFENGVPRQLLFDYEISLEEEPCTDIKIKSSPKGGFHKTILATYLSGHIKLWDTTIGKCLFTMKENRHLYGVNYHPRKTRFVTVGNDAKVNVYDEETRVMERVLSRSEVFGSTNGHTDCVCCAQFHPKNHFELISAGMDNTIQFWDLRAPHAVRNIQDVCPYGEGLDLSEDGSKILTCASSSPNCDIRVYDYVSGEMLQEIQSPGHYAYTVKFLTSTYVGVGTFYRHSFRIINLETSEAVGFVTDLPAPVMSFALSRKVPQFRVDHTVIPKIAVCSAEKVFELEMIHDAYPYM